MSLYKMDYTLFNINFLYWFYFRENYGHLPKEQVCMTQLCNISVQLIKIWRIILYKTTGNYMSQSKYNFQPLFVHSSNLLHSPFFQYHELISSKWLYICIKFIDIIKKAIFIQCDNYISIFGDVLLLLCIMYHLCVFYNKSSFKTEHILVIV